MYCVRESLLFRNISLLFLFVRQNNFFFKIKKREKKDYTNDSFAHIRVCIYHNEAYRNGLRIRLLMFLIFSMYSKYILIHGNFG